MAESKKQRKIPQIIFDSLIYVGVFVFLILALICAIAHMNGSNFYLFGSRYDVVLTDSMSKKNDKYKDFLNGHNDQYNAFDVVVSKEVTKPSQLKLYDVVIYKDRSIGTNMHRIVDVIPEGYDELTLEYVTTGSLNGYNGLAFNEIQSDLLTNEIEFKHLEVTTFTTIDDNGDHFNFNIQGKDEKPTIVQTTVNGGFITTYKIDRKSSSPAKIVLAHKKGYEYNQEIITSIKIKAALGTIEIKDDSELVAEGNNLLGKFNNTYKYEIRGDKSSNSDGIYSLREIESKVVRGIPKLGYLIRFLSSIWGGLLFILLAILIIVFDIVYGKMTKAEELAMQANNDALNNDTLNAETPLEEAKNEQSAQITVKKTTRKKKEHVVVEEKSPLESKGEQDE